MTLIVNPGAPNAPTQALYRAPRAFTPGVGGFGNIRRTGEGDPRYYGDYTPSELSNLRRPVDPRTPVIPGSPLAGFLNATGGAGPATPAWNFTGTGYRGTPTAYNTPAASQYNALQQIANRGSF